jgi:hypothetical protein
MQANKSPRRKKEPSAYLWKWGYRKDAEWWKQVQHELIEEGVSISRKLIELTDKWLQEKRKRRGE